MRENTVFAHDCAADPKSYHYVVDFELRFFTMTELLKPVMVKIAVMSLLFASSYSQAQFANVSDALGITVESDQAWPTGLSCYDFNKDGLDDLTIATNGNGIKTYLNTGSGFEEVFLFSDLEGDIKGLNWIDYDNDGDADLFASRYLDYCVLFRNDGNLQFSDESYQLIFPIPNSRVYSVCWADYDNDSYLDLYVCNYYMNYADAPNWLYHNNGDGTFTELAGALGIDNGVKTTYQSTWIDYDLDHDMDLFVGNDRQFGNSLYRNNGDGTFDDVTVASGLDQPMDAMGVSWNDYDNDGDFDLSVTNSEAGGYHYNNDNGYFTNVATDYGIECSMSVSWGILWMDVDNDLDHDLYIANDSYLANGQNYYFECLSPSVFAVDPENDFVDDDLKSYAAGEFDFDNNGFPDFAVLNTAPASLSLWQNSNIDGNWIKVGLTGTMSNHDAIGATIIVHVGDHILMEQIMSSESFMTQCSQYELFGLGEFDVVDSLEILWPSGWIDTYYDLPVNQFHAFVEGETMLIANQIWNVLLCPEESAMLQAGIEGAYLWSNNTTESSLTVSEAGIYAVSIIDDLGFVHQTTFNVEEFVMPQIGVSIVSPSCAGIEDGLIEIEIDPSLVSAIYWEGEEVSSSTFYGMEGVYSYIIEFNSGCSMEGIVELLAPQSMEISLSADPVCQGDYTSIDFEVSGAQGEILLDWQNTNPENAGAGLHTLIATDENGCSASSEILIESYPDFSVDVQTPIACFEETVAVSVEVAGPSDMNYTFDYDDQDPNALLAGDYNLMVTNQYGCYHLIPFVVEQYPEIIVTSEIIPANASNGGSISLNINGGAGNFDVQWSNGMEGTSISDLLQGNYDAFISDDAGCEVNYQCEVLNLSVCEMSNNVSIYPTPFNDYLVIETDLPRSYQFFDASGKLIQAENSNETVHRISTSDLTCGKYFVTVDGHTYVVIK